VDVPTAIKRLAVLELQSFVDCSTDPERELCVEIGCVVWAGDLLKNTKCIKYINIYNKSAHWCGISHLRGSIIFQPIAQATKSIFRSLVLIGHMVSSQNEGIAFTWEVILQHCIALPFMLWLWLKALVFPGRPTERRRTAVINRLIASMSWTPWIQTVLLLQATREMDRVTFP